MRVERITLAEWAASLPDAGIEAFHSPGALRVLDSHSRAELRIYAGYKGDQTVAMCPLFVRDRGLGVAVFSPPPGFGVPHLGPVLLPSSPKRKKRERINRQFADALIDEFDVTSSRTLFRMIGSPTYGDPRPFGWSGLAVEPSFTYRLSVDGASAEQLMRRFSKSLRWEMRKLDDLDVSIDVEGIGAAKMIHGDVVDRYESQGESFPVTWGFVRDLLSALDDRARVYVARDGTGEYLSGIVVLYSTDTAYYWLGGARSSYGNVSVNNLLQRRILQDFEDPPGDEIESYDLVGANTRRISSYKAQFGGELVPYFVVESDGVGMALAKKAYELVAGIGAPGL